MDAVDSKYPCNCELCNPNGYSDELEFTAAKESHVQNDQESEAAGLRLLDAAARQQRWFSSGARN